jgi:A/G-specific adenine glycosylase
MAEIMLQRTTPGHVVPVYRRFQYCYPTAQRLAAAEQSEVLLLLEPLGLPRRFVLIHRLAEALTEHWGGCPPDDFESLTRLPGVGPYTARAVMCLAYGRDVAMPDVNAIRVVSRAYGVVSSKKRPHTDHELWSKMDALVPEGGGREFNLALIDLGTMVCKKRSPRCGECPFCGMCAHPEGAAASAR